jgi:hypothetical protein
MPIAFLRLACAVRPEYASRIVAVLAGSIPQDMPDGTDALCTKHLDKAGDALSLYLF